MKAKDTVMPIQKLEMMYLHSKNSERVLSEIAQAQAEISFSKGETQGIQKGRKEVVEWLKEYAIHGGKAPLKTVLLDMEVHSPFMRD